MRKLLSLISFLASACSPCTKLPFSAEDRTWVTAYPQVGQKLTFRSNRGNAATFTVVELVDTYNNLDCNRLALGPNQPAHFHVTLRPVAFPEGGRSDLTLYVLKWSGQQPAKLDFRMAGLEAYFHEEYDEHHFQLLTRPCTLASGRHYPQAYYFEAGRNAIDYGVAQLRAFYWDKQDGLVRYELPDGEVFELTDG
jgi:hypothetical protein